MGCFGENFIIDEWHAKGAREEVVDPERVIVDAHHHLWDPLGESRGDTSLVAKLTKNWSRAAHDWLLTKLFPKTGLEAFGFHNHITDKYLSDDLIKDFAGHKVVKTVSIEAQYADKKVPEALSYVGESKLHYENSLKTPGGFSHAHVCHTNMLLGGKAMAESLAAHLKANPNVRGLRHQMAMHPSKTIFDARDAKKDMMKDAKFHESLEELEKLNLSYEIYVYHNQLKDVAEMTGKHPNMKFMLDHCGQPLGKGMYSGEAGKKKAFDEWNQGVELVAANKNVWCKLSGLTMPIVGLGFELRDVPPTSDEVAEAMLPFISRLLELFGVERCMFASNFPVDRPSCSYLVLYNAFKKVCDKLELSEEDRDLLFSKNAITFYRMDE